MLHQSRTHAAEFETWVCNELGRLDKVRTRGEGSQHLLWSGPLQELLPLFLGVSIPSLKVVLTLAGILICYNVLCIAWCAGHLHAYNIWITRQKAYPAWVKPRVPAYLGTLFTSFDSRLHTPLWLSMTHHTYLDLQQEFVPSRHFPNRQTARGILLAVLTYQRKCCCRTCRSSWIHQLEITTCAVTTYVWLHNI